MTSKQPKTQYRKVPGAKCLYRRSKLTPDGRETSQAWIWRSAWQGKTVDVTLAPEAILPEAAARELARVANLYKANGYTLDQVKGEIAGFMMTVAEARLAAATEEALAMTPIAGGQFAAKAKEQDETVREWIARVLRPQDGAQ